MAYVAYRHELLRSGFKPAHRNVEAAVGLGGLGDTTLDPIDTAVMNAIQAGDTSVNLLPYVELQPSVTPFSAAAPQVPNGAVVTYQGQITTTFAPSSVVSSIKGALNNLGLLVISESDDAGIMGSLGLNFSGKVNIALRLQVNDGGHAQAQDVAAIVNHVVYQTTGITPSGSITSVQNSSSAGGGPVGAGGENPSTANWSAIVGWGLAGIAALVLTGAIVGRR